MIHFVHGIAIIITKSKGQNERWNGIDCSNDVSDGYLAMGQGTTEKIFTISRPPQVVSSALHAQKPRSLSLLLADNTHPSSSSSVSHTPLYLSHSYSLYSKSLPSPQSFCQQCLHARPGVRGCTFLFVVGNYGSPQPLGWLVPLFCSCHHEDFIGAHSFTGSMPLLTPNLSFRI